MSIISYQTKALSYLTSTSGGALVPPAEQEKPKKRLLQLPVLGKSLWFETKAAPIGKTSKPQIAVGQRFQGPSGRWFIKLPSGRIAPAKGDNANQTKPEEKTSQEGETQKRKPLDKPKVSKPRQRAEYSQRGSSQANAEVTASVMQHYEKIKLKSHVDAEDTRILTEQMMQMTVAGIQALKKELQVKSSGKNKQALVDKTVVNLLNQARKESAGKIQAQQQDQAFRQIEQTPEQQPQQVQQQAPAPQPVPEQPPQPQAQEAPQEAPQAVPQPEPAQAAPEPPQAQETVQEAPAPVQAPEQPVEAPTQPESRVAPAPEPVQEQQPEEAMGMEETLQSMGGDPENYLSNEAILNHFATVAGVSPEEAKQFMESKVSKPAPEPVKPEVPKNKLSARDYLKQKKEGKIPDKAPATQEAPAQPKQEEEPKQPTGVDRLPGESEQSHEKRVRDFMAKQEADNINTQLDETMKKEEGPMKVFASDKRKGWYNRLINNRLKTAKSRIEMAMKNPTEGNMEMVRNSIDAMEKVARGSKLDMNTLVEKNLPELDQLLNGKSQEYIAEQQQRWDAERQGRSQQMEELQQKFDEQRDRAREGHVSEENRELNEYLTEEIKRNKQGKEGAKKKQEAKPTKTKEDVIKYMQEDKSPTYKVGELREKLGMGEEEFKEHVLKLADEGKVSLAQDASPEALGNEEVIRDGDAYITTITPMDKGEASSETPAQASSMDNMGKEANNLVPGYGLDKAVSSKSTPMEKASALAELDTKIFDPLYRMGKGEGLFTHNEYIRRAVAGFDPKRNPKDLQASMQRAKDKILKEAVPGLRKLAEQGVNNLEGKKVDLNKVADFYEKYGPQIIDQLMATIPEKKNGR